MIRDRTLLDYENGEIVWGFLIVIGIALVNGVVLLVVAKSRELWKPRHLWMACLCITDLVAGVHKCLELLTLVWESREVCVLQRATLGIPFVINMLLLTLLSLDRFVAVRYPFYYSSSVSNRHVLIGFLLVLLTGMSLSTASISMGMKDPVCRAHKLQLVYLTVIVTTCSVVTLFFNSSVLKIAKRQLTAIYAHEPSVNPRRVSLFCYNCGHRNTTFVNSIVSQDPSATPAIIPGTPKPGSSVMPIIPIPIALPKNVQESIVLTPFDLHSHLQRGVDYERNRIRHESARPASLLLEHAMMRDVGLPPPTRTQSLPILGKEITLIVPSDPTISPSAVPLSGSTADLMENTIKVNSSSPELKSLFAYPQSITIALPRSRSFTCAGDPNEIAAARSHPLFGHFHMTGSQIFQMGRLFPSIRFARTVLLIMIPMWLFILPVIIIIPLHRGCVDNGRSEYDCEVVDKLWDYLIIHVRSILPLQAIVDALIYAIGSKEFRQSFWTVMRGRRNGVHMMI